jgi:hypothetical protein
MKNLARWLCGLGLVLLATWARAVDITGSWSVCFPPIAFCQGLTASMVGANDAFTITTSFCTISGTVNPTTGKMTVQTAGKGGNPPL